MQYQGIQSVTNPDGDIDLVFHTGESMHDQKLIRDPEFYAAFRKEINAIMQTIIPMNPVQESMEEFYTRRHEWAVSGSAGRIKLVIPAASVLAEKVNGISKETRIRFDKL